MNKNVRTIALVIVLGVIVSSIYYLESQKARPGMGALVSNTEELECIPGPSGSCTTTESMKTEEAAENPPEQVKKIVSTELFKKGEKYKKYVEISNPSGFLNTNGKPLTIGELIGKKLVLVDFWTYSCINCQRTLPYLTSWYEKYKDVGLEIVSIHTPEFEFEKKTENVQAAAERFGIHYPIVQDNDYGTWRAYGNFYWPRKYLIDIDGFIVYDHIGEGAYEETELKIQELLAERDRRLGSTSLINKEIIAPTSVETVDPSKPRTPEIYFGAWRNNNFGNGEKNTIGIQTLTLPTLLRTHALYFGGTWNIQSEYAVNTSANARVQIRYQAQKVFMVASSDSPVTVQIVIDGKPITQEMRGADVLDDGTVIINEERLYRLIEGGSWGEHTLELIIKDPGLETFTFTFG